MRKELSKNNKTLITTKELAEKLGTSPKVILENAKKCLPNKVIENGKTTFWNKAEITVLIEQMKTSNPNQSTFTAPVKVTETELTPTLKIETTKQLAEELGVSLRTIQQVIASKGYEIKFVPFQTKGGIQKMACVTEEQATAIKIELQNHSKIAKNGYDTLSIANDLEMMIIQKKLDAYKDRRVAELTKENEIIKPKAECYDNYLSRDKFCNFRDASKYFGISQTEFMIFLKKNISTKIQSVNTEHILNIQNILYCDLLIKEKIGLGNS